MRNKGNVIHVSMLHYMRRWKTGGLKGLGVGILARMKSARAITEMIKNSLKSMATKIRSHQKSSAMMFSYFLPPPTMISKIFSKETK